MVVISKHLKIARRSQRLSQEDFADALGVTANYISLLENGRKSPSLPFLKNISKKFKYPLFLFLKEELLPAAKNEKERELRAKLESILDELENLVADNDEAPHQE